MRILLREIRESKHMSRRALAARAGVSRSWIEEMEGGDANPSILMLCKLARVLGVAPSELYVCEDSDFDDNNGLTR